MLLLVFLVFRFCTCIDTITVDRPLKDGDILVSNGETFALGFFSPGNSKNRYLGIWYKKVSKGTVVWVANMEASVSDASGVLNINDKGILSIMNGTKGTVCSSNTSRNTAKEPVAQLLDLGNFVVKDGKDSDPTNVLWQSFDYPTNTWLSLMKIGFNWFNHYLNSLFISSAIVYIEFGFFVFCFR